MMNARISLEDWERLSAYLDNQLSPDEISVLEKKLAQQPDLQAELNELQQLKLAFRSLPQRKAPRNYTLKPGLIKQKSFSFPFLVPAFSIGSALAVLLLVFSFLFQTRQPSSVALEPPQAAMLEMDQNLVQPATGEAEPPEIIIWGGATGMGGGGGAEGMGGYTGGIGGGPAALTVEQPAPEAAAKSAAEETAREAAPTPTEGGATAKQIPEPLTSASPEAQQNLIVGIRPEEQRGQILSTPETLSTQPPAVEKRSLGMSFSTLQILLASLAVIFGLTAYLLSKRTRITPG